MDWDAIMIISFFVVPYAFMYGIIFFCDEKYTSETCPYFNPDDCDRRGCGFLGECQMKDHK